MTYSSVADIRLNEVCRPMSAVYFQLVFIETSKKGKTMRYLMFCNCDNRNDDDIAQQLNFAVFELT